jgi:ssDNA-binding Zn-finger/Zn-ribbon topoisomerase 1
MPPRCPVCGAMMVAGHPKGWRCPTCNPRPEIYIAGRPTVCPLCEVPLGPKHTCPTCDHAYRTERSGRFVLPSRVVAEGTLLGECKTQAGVREIYAYGGAFVRMTYYDETFVPSSRRVMPKVLTEEKAMAYLRAMANRSRGSERESMAVGIDPEDCTLTPDGRRLIGAARRALRRQPRPCACVTVAKAKAAKTAGRRR